eukprot:CAMPEP_0172516888 /NCGR_PEP_ID=MMETSP1066-20121228/279868_1 /TAXON_ID=671091 /ORGANISM="Coscinodiscus wailesii, Strain CCMP2513" /LENGTH=92 /DNA_ID=CAMNT_0013298575 /DNA_START=28 /DNA_END=303 /DNA_ORIENTATION=+
MFDAGQQSRTLTNDNNSMGQVPPVLECHDNVTGDTVRLTQSLPILDFLENIFPHREGTLLSHLSDVMTRTRVRQVAEIVRAGIQTDVGGRVR